MQTETIKVYRCRRGSCNKLSTNAMIRQSGKCFNCYYREFTSPGKIGFFEEIITLYRHNKAVQGEKKCLTKKN